MLGIASDVMVYQGTRNKDEGLECVKRCSLCSALQVYARIKSVRGCTQYPEGTVKGK